MPGYCEENYLVGKCEECHGNYRKQKGSGSLPLSKPAGQSSLSSFLKVKTKSPVLHVEKDARKTNLGLTMLQAHRAVRQKNVL